MISVSQPSCHSNSPKRSFGAKVQKAFAIWPLHCTGKSYLEAQLTKEAKYLSSVKQPPEVVCKESVLRNFAKFIGKHLCQSLFFNKVAGPKRLWHRCFPVNYAKFSRTPFPQSSSGRLI